MTHLDSLTHIFSHNRWANVRLLERCAELTPEQLDMAVIGVFGTIRDTLEHIALSERSYFARISTGKRYERPAGEEALTIAQIMDSLQASGAGLIEWATRVQPADTVVIDWDGTPRNVPKTTILTQAINHATEHRAQVTMMMTQVGVEPPDLQSWAYYQETGE